MAHDVARPVLRAPRRVALWPLGLAALVACAVEPRPEACEEPALFGVPNAATGLGADQCGPACTCDGFTPPAYGAEDVAAMRAWTLETPLSAPASDPYAAPAGPSDGVCAVQIRDATVRTYALATYESAAAAEADGGVYTHDGACGLCSTLADLAVYVGLPDLTGPGRTCGLEGMFGGTIDDVAACFEKLGFTTPCAWTWAYNAQHTQGVCLEPCLAALDQPYHTPDGAMNACLVCDETESGPVFKAVAGRTRRSSGLPSAQCRPCDEVTRVVHDWR